jgi:hypothetical protein
MQAHLWRIANVTGGKPTLSSITNTGCWATYADPPPASQAGTSALLAGHRVTGVHEPSASGNRNLHPPGYAGGNRTGPTSGAATDPDGKSFWLAGEANTVVGGACQWATTINGLTP